MTELRTASRLGARDRHPSFDRHDRSGRPQGDPAPVVVPLAGAGPKPPAVIPEAVRGSRTVDGATTTIVATDFSGSTAWTDPDNARIHDLRLSLEWAERNMAEDDEFVLISFTDDAAATSAVGSADALAAVDAGQPAPAGLGGTAFVPVAQQALAAVDDVASAHLVLVSDGMSGDVSSFAGAVAAAQLRTTLVPFGSDWPFVKAGWEHAAHIRLAAHVSDRPLAIARALAHVMLELTGQVPGRPRSRLRRVLSR